MTATPPHIVEAAKRIARHVFPNRNPDAPWPPADPAADDPRDGPPAPLWTHYVGVARAALDEPWKPTDAA